LLIGQEEDKERKRKKRREREGREKRVKDFERRQGVTQVVTMYHS